MNILKDSYKEEGKKKRNPMRSFLEEKKQDFYDNPLRRRQAVYYPEEIKESKDGFHPDRP